MTRKATKKPPANGRSLLDVLRELEATRKDCPQCRRPPRPRARPSSGWVTEPVGGYLARSARTARTPRRVQRPSNVVKRGRFPKQKHWCETCLEESPEYRRVRAWLEAYQRTMDALGQQPRLEDLVEGGVWDRQVDAVAGRHPGKNPLKEIVREARESAVRKRQAELWGTPPTVARQISREQVEPEVLPGIGEVDVADEHMRLGDAHQKWNKGLDRTDPAALSYYAFRRRIQGARAPFEGFAADGALKRIGRETHYSVSALEVAIRRREAIRKARADRLVEMERHLEDEHDRAYEDV
jgi:hypothetical protein